MGILADSLERAGVSSFTRPIPKGAGVQMRFLVRQHKGSTQAVADLLGVSQRTVERYVAGQFKRPRPELAARLAGQVRARWQPKVREAARKRAATTGGIVIETRARFGYTAAPGSTDDPRTRLLTQALPPPYAARLFAAHAAGAPTDRELEDVLRTIAAEGLQEIYFKDRGQRAQGLLVEFTDIDYIDLDY